MEKVAAFYPEVIKSYGLISVCDALQLPSDKSFTLPLGERCTAGLME